MVLRKLINFAKFVYSQYFFDRFTLDFINSNKKIFKNIKPNVTNSEIILIDLFDWKPWILIWSQIAKYFYKNGYQVKFFYFPLYKTKLGFYNIYIRKLIKIYDSFKTTNGINELDFKYSESYISKIKNKFIKIKTKEELSEYKINNLKVGDLIYATYLRSSFNPTINFGDQYLFQIFLRAHKIYDKIEEYFKFNNVKAVIPSHICYISYGIIARLAAKNSIKIFKIYSKNRGKSLFRLIKIDPKYCIEENPYYNFKKIFSTFNDFEKEKNLKIGQTDINRRFNSLYDKNLPYMKKGSFVIDDNIDYKKLLNINYKQRNIFVFPHCYIDNCYRYRNMIFTDFYEQIDFILSFSKYKNLKFFYKPHPNELEGFQNTHKMFIEKYQNVTLLNKNFSNRAIIDLKPDLCVTNHGTIAHEMAYFGVPVLNTGDNPHINYDFSYTAKNKEEVAKILENKIDIKSKLKINKNDIYEFIFMQYHYFDSRFDKNNLISDDKFTKHNFNLYNLDDETIKNFEIYLKKFLNNEILSDVDT